MDDMKQNLNELRTVIKTKKIERSLPLETLENSLTGQIFKFNLEEEAQTSEELIHPMLDDIKQNFTNDLKNVMKVEKIESSLHSETPEITSTGHTVEEISAEERQSYEEQSHSVLDDIKQDFTNDLKNAMRIEKTESNLHLETPENISTGHTLEQYLTEEKQEKKVNKNQEWTLNQDMYARNTKKDWYAPNLKDEGQFSYYNRTNQLAFAEEKFKQFQL
ncbi:zinc finger protein 708, partial [Biomphalaria pfeifferi]